MAKRRVFKRDILGRFAGNGGSKKRKGRRFGTHGRAGKLKSKGGLQIVTYKGGKYEDGTRYGDHTQAHVNLARGKGIKGRVRAKHINKQYFAKIKADGHSRYSYSKKPITSNNAGVRRLTPYTAKKRKKR